MEKVNFDELSKRGNLIKMMYQKARIRSMYNSENEYFIVVKFNDVDGQAIKMDPLKFLNIISEALNMMSSTYRKIIEVELLESVDEKPFWYLNMLSRSTYFRYRKEAFRIFLSYFE